MRLGSRSRSLSANTLAIVCRSDGGAGAQDAAKPSQNNWAAEVTVHHTVSWAGEEAPPCQGSCGLYLLCALSIAAFSGAADSAQGLQGRGVLGSALRPPRRGRKTSTHPDEEAGWSLQDTGDAVARYLPSLLEFTPR